MRNIQATGNIYGKQVTINQVSKAKAKKIFAAGKEIYLQSSNYYPFGVWQSVCPIKLDDEQLQADIKHNNWCINLYQESVDKFTKSNEEWSNNLIAGYQEKVNAHVSKVINSNTQFDSKINEYSYYNCDSERGKYVTYYANNSDI